MILERIEVSAESILDCNGECLNNVSKPESSSLSYDIIAALTKVSNAALVRDVFVGSNLKLLVINTCSISESITYGLTVKILNLLKSFFNCVFSAVVKLFEY